MEKTFIFNAYGNDHKIALRKSNYLNNGTLAVFMVEIFDDGHEEPWGDLTVNIEDSNELANPIDTAFVDTNNNGSIIIPWLSRNNIADVTGVMGFSGFCCYPLVRFKKEVIDAMPSL